MDPSNVRRQGVRAGRSFRQLLTDMNADQALLSRFVKFQTQSARRSHIGRSNSRTVGMPSEQAGMQSKDSFYLRDNMTSFSGSGADHHSQSAASVTVGQKVDDADDYLGEAGVWATEHMRKTAQQNKDKGKGGPHEGDVVHMLSKLGEAVPVAPQVPSRRAAAPGRARQIRQSGTKLALEQVERWRGAFCDFRDSKRNELALVLAARKLDRVYVAESDLLMGKMFKDVQFANSDAARLTDPLVIEGLGDLGVTSTTVVREKVHARPGRKSAPRKKVHGPSATSPRKEVEEKSIWGRAKKWEPKKRCSGLVAAKKAAKGEALYRSLLIFAVSKDFGAEHDHLCEDLILFVKRRLESGWTEGDKIYKDTKRFVGRHTSPAIDELLAFLKSEVMKR